eukprot:GFKZ01012100.1.p1 GENE.GFKZ01012100.1~~GFKZ01012100.1.p1  ORF type:complete len:424 (+),score=76.85 GFKZ01012100.1:42-1274(+)
MKPSEALAELSLPPNASADQIRRAYKRACLRWHPDKHPPGPPRDRAETKFKAITVAYSRLCDLNKTPPAARPTDTPSDPHTAHHHDHDDDDDNADPFADAAYRKQFASGFAKQFAAQGYHVDADTLFDSLFGEARREFKFDNTASGDGGAVVRLDDRLVDLAVTLEELAAGCVKKRRVRNVGRDPVVLNVCVKPGYREGDRVRFRDVVVEGGRKGDIVFVIRVVDHARFVTDGDDVSVTVTVDLVDALAGVGVVVDGVCQGEQVKVRVDSVVYPGYVHVVAGKGLPRRERPETRGELRVLFEIAFPKRVEAEDRAAVRELFARLERHAACRKDMRRSSSLFTNRGAGVGGMGVGGGMFGGRRHTMAPRGGGKMAGDGGLGDMDGEDALSDDAARGFGRGKSKLRIPNIFR